MPVLPGISAPTKHQRSGSSLGFLSSTQPRVERSNLSQRAGPERLRFDAFEVRRDAARRAGCS
jgi:hypothetical protein